jgi:hypothetical protein
MKANAETAATICKTLGIGQITLYRYLIETVCTPFARRHPYPPARRCDSPAGPTLPETLTNRP